MSELELLKIRFEAMIKILNEDEVTHDYMKGYIASLEYVLEEIEKGLKNG